MPFSNKRNKTVGEITDSRIGTRNIKMATEHLVVLKVRGKILKPTQLWKYVRGAQGTTERGLGYQNWKNANNTINGC